MELALAPGYKAVKSDAKTRIERNRIFIVKKIKKSLSLII